MIWLTWRQFRVQALALLIPLVALAVALIWTEPGLAHLYSANGLNRCAVPGDCGQRTTAFLTAVQSSKYPLGYFVGGAVLYLFPAVIGAFWGAPLISRELEAGTFRAGVEPVGDQDPVDAGQAGARRPDGHGDRRAGQRAGLVVGGAG